MNPAGEGNCYIHVDKCLIWLSGLSSTTTPMYIAESAPAPIRGRLVSVNIVMLAAGQFIANCVAGAFSFNSYGWR